MKYCNGGVIATDTLMLMGAPMGCVRGIVRYQASLSQGIVQRATPGQHPSEPSSCTLCDTIQH